MLKVVAAAAVALLTTGACFANSHVTESGLGLPVVVVDFPAEADGGTVETASFSISNPGPGAMAGITITFARVGNDFPIVDTGGNGENPAISRVSPEPLSVDAAAVVYRFDGIPEDGEITIDFDLLIPDRTGVVANSVTVSASEDPQRVEGLRLETRAR